MAINDDLLYEINEQGERVVVKSLVSDQRAYLRFTNKTKRAVDIWWRDFQGVRRHYIRLDADAHYDVNSFITHPWEFTDASTKERYTVNNNPIFRAPANIAGVQYRTNWNIAVGMRSLRETTLHVIALRIPDPELVLNLEMPRGLQYELQELVEKLNNVEPGPGE